jgi:hypothetical protein
MIIETLGLKKLLIAGLLAVGFKKKFIKQKICIARHNTFRCANCGSECDIEDRVIDNCCIVCVSGLGYPKNVYWSDSDKLLVGARK